ncbi:MAG: fibronectin type III domain-containing protein, partial [Acidobacteriaceae bacterium]
GITVSWSTDVPATTQLAYGTSPSLGLLSPLQTALTASHGVVLTTLNPGTTYYFVAQSTGANGATGYSAQYSFTTTGAAVVQPPVISNVAVSSITNTSATITWTTDQASSSLVNFGTTTSYGSSSMLNSTLVTSHSVTLTGLTPGTTYDFDVVSANAGAMSSTSPNSSFLTTSTTSPPVITNVATTNVTSTSVTVTWTTDQPSTSLVNYGTTASYGSSSTLSTALVTAHSVTLTGLVASTTYDFDVVSANATSQSTTSPNSMVTTTAANATPPYVGYVAYWGINNTGITVSWSTDVPANTQLAYGTTPSLGQLSPLQTALAASHGVVLTTLNPGTTYYFVAQSTGANGATGYSTTYSFTTTGTQVTPPPMISNVVATSVSNTSETITWTTDQAASSQVNYGVTTTYTLSSTLNPALVMSHSVTLTGLMPGTVYDFDVMSANSSALSSTSPNATFTTTGAANGPAISNVSSSGVTSGTATITWTTDQTSTSVVNYGTTSSYGSSASAAGLATSHSVMLTGLAPNTTYNFEVVSANAANTSSTSGNYTFTTSPNTAPPPVISYVAFWGITSSGVTISWSTNEAATTAVAYGTTAALGQLTPVQTALTDSHGVTLTGLAAGTTYYFAAQSADGSGNTGSSTNYSFTTLAGPPTISNVTANPAANHTATISWTTSTPTYSYVQYGASAGNYGDYSAQTALTTTPDCTLPYVPSGTIHYQLVSTDAYGNQTVSTDMTFLEP